MVLLDHSMDYHSNIDHSEQDVNKVIAKASTPILLYKLNIFILLLFIINYL